MQTDITAEECKELGINPEDPFGLPPAWELGAMLAQLREGKQQEGTQPAEDGPNAPSAEELAEILAEVYGSEAEQTGEVSEAIGRNGLVLINDPDWIDMTARNMDYMRHVYRSDLNHRDKTVLGVVAMHCGVNSRGCTASNETLAAEANIDKDNFRKRLSWLTKEGWVRENGMMPSVRQNMNGAKVRHIGVKRSWAEGGS
ncbi:hypothetical protein [Streptomyces sp. NPDC047706]|uniref:hypothetical protein n=1 Tax=Streptomyces sp. NPDC047706 TaxID=3365486 RepID=UPI00370FE89D